MIVCKSTEWQNFRTYGRLEKEAHYVTRRRNSSINEITHENPDEAKKFNYVTHILFFIKLLVSMPFM